MIRHPHYLEASWELHWHRDVRTHRHFWWLITLLVLLAILMIGVGVTAGLM